MSAQEIMAGRAVVEATVRDKTDPGIRSAMGKLKSFAAGARALGAGLATIGGGFSAISGAVLAPLGAAAKLFADSGSEVFDLSKSTGLAADNLSELRFAAEQSGASLSDVGAAIRTMQKNGLDANKFDQYAAAVASIPDPAQRTAKALEIFGKSGFKLLPMLQELAELRADARKFGAVISPEDAASADALGDAFGAMKAALGGLKNQIGAAIAEPLTKAITAMSEFIAGVSRFVANNRALVVGVAAGALALGALGAALVAIGAPLAIAGAALSAIPAIVTAIASPIGLAVAGIALLTAGLIAGAAAWLLFTKSGQIAAIGFQTFFGGIFDAIVAGDLLNAWGQLSLGMQNVWLGMVKVVKGAFWEMAKFVGLIISNMLRDLAGFADMVPGAGGLKNLLSGTASQIDNTIAAAATRSLADTESTIRGGIAGLEALRALARAKREAQLKPIWNEQGSWDGGGERGRGPSLGTFNSTTAGLLGRSGPALTEAKKTNTLLEKVAELLGNIDEGIENLEGPLAFE